MLAPVETQEPTGGRLIEFINAQGIELVFNEHIPPAMGMSYDGKIDLLKMQPIIFERLSPISQISTQNMSSSAACFRFLQ